MKKVALRKLADFLSTFKPKKNDKFDMDTWRHEDTPLEESCNTTACAIGHAVINKISPRGLKLVKYLNGGYELYYKTFEAFTAVSCAYGISYSDSRELFSSDGYTTGNVTPKQVAKRIYTFLEENTK